MSQQVLLPSLPGNAHDPGVAGLLGHLPKPPEWTQVQSSRSLLRVARPCLYENLAHKHCHPLGYLGPLRDGYVWLSVYFVVHRHIQPHSGVRGLT